MKEEKLKAHNDLPKDNCYICDFLMNGFWCGIHNCDVAGNPDKTCRCFELNATERTNRRAEEVKDER